MNKAIHSFHIPVMGLAFTIDTPIRVGKYGIGSVISITDDELIEHMRKFYCSKLALPYQEISRKVQDYRAERITHYLNLINDIVKVRFEAFKEDLVESSATLQDFISMLPNASEVKKNLEKLLREGVTAKTFLKNYIQEQLVPGAIDVNIMTKVDKDNFENNTQLPVEFNDAHASLRGFANSNLNSSVVLSAGMNPRLYSYFERFSDFYPDDDFNLKKKITLKVSDFRSAMIQGNFLAKKGLWVSEYRIESGLNCGGHAFATEGYLLGPILEEFKNKKDQLIQSTHDLLIKALECKGMPVPSKPLALNITAQGGVGTSEEHEFLLKNFRLDAVGWGSPFLLVPEATSVDQETRNLLINAKEDDFYLSNISPLGVPFNSIKGVTNDFWKQKRIDNNKPGSSCPKKFLALSKEYGEKGICTASKKYQDAKIVELESVRNTMTLASFENNKNKITEKSCLCVGLANASYLENDIPLKGENQGVVICPGPNLAYFNKEVSLLEMVRHIYGNTNVISHADRPNMFIKELKMYIDYFNKEIQNFTEEITTAKIKKWRLFKNNILEGIEYYENLFNSTLFFKKDTLKINNELKTYKTIINQMDIEKYGAYQ